MFERRLRKHPSSDRTASALTQPLEPGQPYTYGAGSLVRIAQRETLERFAASWRWHHPLQPEQFEYAGQTAKVREAGLYHGGDELYELQDLPGYWHLECLEPAS